MKKYEKYSREQLQKFCDESESIRELSMKVGYAPDSGSAAASVKQMISDLELDCSHFVGQGHTKNIGVYKTPTIAYLNNKVKVQSHKLRIRLLEEGIFEAKCNRCGLDSWLGQPIPLELHHKDGNKDNNSLDNLELLCPNCHYFTDTYKIKNWKTRAPSKETLE